MITRCHSLNVIEQLLAECIFISIRLLSFNSPTTESEQAAKVLPKLLDSGTGSILFCLEAISIDDSVLGGVFDSQLAIIHKWSHLPSHAVVNLFKPDKAISDLHLVGLVLCQVYEAMVIIFVRLCVFSATIEEKFVWFKDLLP